MTIPAIRRHRHRYHRYAASSEPASGFKVRRALPSSYGRMVGPSVLFAGEVESVGRTGLVREAELLLLEPGAEIVLKAPAFPSTRLMLLGGEPFFEHRHVYWNFVSSSAERIEQAKARLA